MRKLAIVLVGLLILVFVIGAIGCDCEEAAPPPPTALQVHFIDVGQGDSILLDLGDTEVLIDGGDRSPGVVAYLEDHVDDGSLEAMIATHPHADHIGGLIAVLDAFEVKQIWHNGQQHNTQTYSEFMARVTLETDERYEARRGDTIEVGELVFNVLHPVNLSGTTNNNSIVLSLSYEQVDFLFTGDAEQEAEASILVQSAVPIPDIDILKVGHHGSRTSSSQLFLDTVRPEVAVYMAGTDNKHGHPHEDTISVLCDAGVTVYGTDVHGTIKVTTDGTTVDIEPLNDEPLICDERDGRDLELTVNISGQGTTYPSEGTHFYDEEEQVTITALADSGWEFDYWGGDTSGTSSQTTVVMTSDKSVTAYFIPLPPEQYNLTVDVSPSGSGSVSLSPPGGTYDSGTTVTITIQPVSGCQFDHWEGDASGTSTQTIVIIDTNKSITAHFTSNSYCAPCCQCYSYTEKSDIQCSQAGAICNDGTCSMSTGSGTCSWHGGVMVWIYCP